MIILEQIYMKLTHEEKDILHQFTNDLEDITVVRHRDYVTDIKLASKWLDENHVVWLHTQPGNMYLIPKK